MLCGLNTLPLELFILQALERRHLRHNFVVNVTDGAFFGFAMGVASFVTVIPLFVATLTDSTLLIGLIASIHATGWQFPQLFTANRVARLRRYKPMVVWLTLNERWPFFGLAVVAALLPVISRELALVLTFIMLVIQGFGGGFAATAWQAMIAKLMPSNLRGTFYGTQSAFANLLSSGGAVLAGVLLAGFAFPTNFTICFLIAGIAMMVSFGFIVQTRESEGPAAREIPLERRDYWQRLWQILRTDANFRLFIVTRILAQVASMGLAFFTIYAVRRYGMSEQVAGVMTGVLLLGQTLANPIMGWLGDRRSHRLMFALGALMAMAGAILALASPHLNWFYIVFALSGVAQAALWTTSMAMTAAFGQPEDRPYYIGLANTLTAPATLLAPIIGGWLADSAGFEATFLLAASSGLATAILLIFGVREQQASVSTEPQPAEIPAESQAETVASVAEC